MAQSWFSTVHSSTSHTSLERLLELLKSSLRKYFRRLHVSHETFGDFLASIDEQELNRIDQLFLAFLKQKGLPLLHMCAEIDVHWSEELLAKLEYERFILYEEYKEFDDRDGVRSSIINLITELPSLLQDK